MDIEKLAMLLASLGLANDTEEELRIKKSSREVFEEAVESVGGLTPLLKKLTERDRSVINEKGELVEGEEVLELVKKDVTVKIKLLGANDECTRGMMEVRIQNIGEGYEVGFVAMMKVS